MERITASPQHLFKDGEWAAREALTTGAAEIDRLFGKGYAREHPTLLAAFVDAAVHAGTAAIGHAVQQDASRDLSSAITSLADSISQINFGAD